MTKPVINQANNSGTSKASSTLYEHSINTNNGLPKYQHPNHCGHWHPAMQHNKSNRLEYQQDSQELRIATIAALSQQIKGKPLRNNFLISFSNIIMILILGYGPCDHLIHFGLSLYYFTISNRDVTIKP